MARCWLTTAVFAKRESSDVGCAVEVRVILLESPRGRIVVQQKSGGVSANDSGVVNSEVWSAVRLTHQYSKLNSFVVRITRSRFLILESETDGEVGAVLYHSNSVYDTSHKGGSWEAPSSGTHWSSIRGLLVEDCLPKDYVFQRGRCRGIW